MNDKPETKKNKRQPLMFSRKYQEWLKNSTTNAKINGYEFRGNQFRNTDRKADV